MPCAGPIQQEGLAQILRQRKASEYRKTCRGRSPCGHSARTREPRRGLIKIKKAPARRATPIRPPRRTMPQDAERPAGDPPAVPARPTMPGGAVCAATPIGPPATPLPPHNAERPAGDVPPRASRGAIEKRPPRARRPALPQPCAAVLSAKAGLTAGFGMGPGDPRLCGRARGGRSPAAHDMEPARSPHRGDPGGRMAGTEEDGASRSVLHRGCEELGLLVPLG